MKTRLAGTHPATHVMFPLVVLSIAMSASPAGAQTLREDFSTSNGFEDMEHSNNGRWFYQTFQASSDYNIYSVKMKFFRATTGDTPGLINVYIRATTGGVPAGANLATGSTNADTLTTSTAGEVREFILDANPLLVSGTTYAIVFNAPNLLNLEKSYVHWDTSAGYAAGVAASDANTDSGYSVYSPARDFYFQTFGTDPLEACCLPDHSCVDQTPADCTTAGGTSQGLGTNCLEEPDSDGDSARDFCDDCPLNPEKYSVGECGCDLAETGDSDVDNMPDCLDNCPNVPNPGQEDADGDGIGNECDFDVPRVIHYQGKLRDTSGAVITDTVAIRFRLYVSSTDETPVLFDESHPAVVVSNGLFNVRVGSATSGGVPDSAVDAGEVWLGVTVGAGPELAPRSRVASTPYSIKSKSAEQLVRPGTLSPAVTVNSAGRVGIGTMSPGQPLSVAGMIESTSGGYKFPDGSTQSTAAVSGKTYHRQVFTSSGIWTRPSGVNEVTVTVVGGGGPGGAGGSDHSSGGGAGGYAVGTTTVSGAAAVTVGAATQASSFAGDTVITANGGSPGTNCCAGSGCPNWCAGGVGGTVVNANVLSVAGQPGQSAGNNNQWPMMGEGGSTPIGIGGLPVNFGNQSGFSDPRNGMSGTGYGSGGSGSRGSGTPGLGAPGIVIVEWYE